ncbi:MAG TPA: sigma factor [Candidatus Lokiarchaeia archaeon]
MNPKMVKDNITEFVIDYKTNPTVKKIGFIFKELQIFINKTSRRVYYRKNLTVGKQVYSISDSSYELEDVKQDVCLEIMRLINNFDITKSFNTYLISSLYKYQPHFVNKAFINELVGVSLDHIEEDIGEFVKSNTSANSVFADLAVEDILNQFENSIDKNIVKSYLENPNITESELGAKYKVTQQYISLRLGEIRKILKNYL